MYKLMFNLFLERLGKTVNIVYGLTPAFMMLSKIAWSSIYEHVNIIVFCYVSCGHAVFQSVNLCDDWVRLR